MSEFQQIEITHDHHSKRVLSLSLAVFQRLGWQAEVAEWDRIIAHTPPKNYDKGQSVQVISDSGTLVVKSEMIDEENLDVMNRNRENVEQFQSAFQNIQQEADEEKLLAWESEFDQLQDRTREELEKEGKVTDKEINLSHGSKTVNYVIMGLNILVFIWMVATGVNFFEPTVDDLVKWGGNFRPLTVGGEWWRVFTAVFVHVGVLHLALNMYALYMVGMYLEPLLGKARFIGAYVATGILASLVSLWWNDGGIISAGASGAIFGMYGVFLALLTTSIIPTSIRSSLLSSIGVFIFYNIIYGAGKEGIDNAAHLGGLGSGLIVGYMFLPGLKNPSVKKSFTISIAVVLMAIVISGFYIAKSSDDSLAYEKKINQILVLQEEALAALQTDNDAELQQRISTVAKPKWGKAKTLVEETGNYKLSDHLSSHRELMVQYIDLRIQQSELILSLLGGNASAETELNEITEKINAVIEKMEANQKT